MYLRKQPPEIHLADPAQSRQLHHRQRGIRIPPGDAFLRGQKTALGIPGHVRPPGLLPHTADHIRKNPPDFLLPEGRVLLTQPGSLRKQAAQRFRIPQMHAERPVRSVPRQIEIHRVATARSALRTETVSTAPGKIEQIPSRRVHHRSVRKYIPPARLRIVEHKAVRIAICVSRDPRIRRHVDGQANLRDDRLFPESDIHTAVLPFFFQHTILFRFCQVFCFHHGHGRKAAV